MELVVVAIAALLTSILSAVAGLGGGVILLAVLLQIFVPVVAIPIHGGIQLVSNGSRAWILRSEISWPVFWRVALPILPASVVGVLVATSLPEVAIRIVLGVFILVLAWKPGLLRWGGERPGQRRLLVGVGAVSGFLTSSIGVSGPVTSPFLKAFTPSHVAFVASAAATQVVAHGAKVAAYSVESFRVQDYASVIAVGAVAVVAGSWVGSRLIGRLSEQQLALVFRWVLTVLALRVLWQGVSALLV